MKNTLLRAFALALLLSLPVSADIIETIGGMNTVIYGIAAGIAALMITLHAVKWKTAENPGDREDAKRGIINVILGLVLIMIAASLVSVVFVKPPEPDVPPTTTTTTEPAQSTTTTIRVTTTTTTTTTTIPPEKLLTAKNLVDCINSKGGKLQSIVPVSGCPKCRLIKCKVFGKETDPPVGPGLVQYHRLDIVEANIGPYFILANGTRMVGCHTMPEINNFFACGLIPLPGHKYYECKEDPGIIKMDCE